jgi:hypothetical protein
MEKRRFTKDLIVPLIAVIAAIAGSYWIGLRMGKPSTLRPMSLTNFSVPPCSGTVNVVAVIRSYLPSQLSLISGFDPAHMTRNVTYKLHTTGYDENEGDSILSVGAAVPDIGAPSLPNPYHMDLTKLPPASVNPNNQASPYVELRFILQDDTDYSFATNLQDGNNAVVGIAAGESPSVARLCGATVIKASPDGGYPPHDAAVVYAPLFPITGKPAQGGYSIILLPKTAPDTPIFIDPKVINNG